MLKSKTPLSSKTGLKSSKPLKKQSSSPKKQPKPSISKLKKETDKWFSKATRYRFAEFKGGEWVAECITCGNEKPIKVLQCGHFMSRQYNSTRFLEQNTAPQCFGCNVMHQGRQYEFGAALDKLYGVGTAKEMHDLAKTAKQFTQEELEAIIKDSKTEVEFYESQDPANQ